MGLLDMVAGAAAEAGTGLGKMGLASMLRDQEAAVQEARDARLREWRNTDTIAAEERGLINSGKKIKIEGEATEANAAKNAPAIRGRKIADATAVLKAQAEYAQDPNNIKAKAAADRLAAELTATNAADLNAELMKRPDYLKNMEKLTLAQNPEKRAQIAASIAASNLSEYKLGQEKLLADARTELSAAKTPEAQKAAKAKIEALEWSVGSERALMTATASMVKSLESTKASLEGKLAGILDDESPAAASIKKSIENLEAEIAAYSADFKKRAGITTPAAKAPAAAGGVQIGTGADAGKVMVDGVLIPGTANTPAEIRALVAQYRKGSGRSSSGLINSGAK